MKDVFGSMDFAKGIAADANVDLATENDAKRLARSGAPNRVFSRRETVGVDLGQREIGIREWKIGVRRNSFQRRFHCPFESASPLRDSSAEQILGVSVPYVATVFAAIAEGGLEPPANAAPDHNGRRRLFPPGRADRQ